MRITKTYAEAAAKAFASIPAPTTKPSPFRFVYVAGGDTTTKPGVLTAFQARIKGETELSLGSICKAGSADRLKGYSVRVFYPDMAGHDAIKPYVRPHPLVHRVSEIIFGTPIRRFAKDLWAPTEQLGEFLTEVSMGRHDDIAAEDGQEEAPGMTLISNADIRRAKGY